MQTRHIVLARRPKGIPRADDFALAKQDLPALAAGEVLIANDFISIDAGVRGFLDDRAGYIEPVRIGAPVHGMTIGRVLDSRSADYPVGTVLRTMASWSEHTIVSAGALGLERVVPNPRLGLQSYMGALGPVGMTAWMGLHEIGKIVPGERVLISAAAGATGGIAVQIAKLCGCYVVGLVGSPEKAARVTGFGADAAIDYRAAPDLGAAVAALFPGGINVFFDSVGAAMLERMLPLMAEQGRIVACGMIADYNDADQPYGVKTLWQIVLKRLTMRGFLLFDHTDRLAEAAAALEAWALDGSLKLDETIYEGVEAAPAAFIDLMSGRTIGKTLVKINNESL